MADQPPLPLHIIPQVHQNLLRSLLLSQTDVQKTLVAEQTYLHTLFDPAPGRALHTQLARMLLHFSRISGRLHR